METIKMIFTKAFKWYGLLMIGMLSGAITFLCNYQIFDSDGFIILKSVFYSLLISVIVGSVNYLFEASNDSKKTTGSFKEYVKYSLPWLIISVFSAFITVGIFSVCIR